jgi:H+-translocating NAD(P) transhydrogenase subunit alpha
MRIFVARESDPAEPRVAATAETVKKMTGLGAEVTVEPGAGVKSGILDADYAAAGATLSDSGRDADIVLRVRRPSEAEITGYKPGALVIAVMDPFGNDAALAAMARAGLTAFAMELMPRITRAQSMDVLSSQANLGGYRAVIDAAAEYGRALPMMMTAAGTVPAAKVFVMGAGVAGLQAIATARRLGAVVTATDVRPAAKEQVQSLGGRFVELPIEAKDAQDAGGYAKAQDEDFYRRQRELLAKVIAESDVVITAAVVPGKKSPVLVTKEMVAGMAPGSVVVDLASERGGNCELTKPGEVIVINGVSIIGYFNFASAVPYHASQMYARNIAAFLQLMVKDGKLQINFEDDIIKSTLVTEGGEVVNARIREFFSLPPLAAQQKGAQ